jgi:hypothetical protein
MNFLLISEIQPSSGTASSEILKRHLERTGIKIHGIDESHPLITRGVIDHAILSALGWFSKEIRQYYVESIEPILKSRIIARRMRSKGIDLILSLAHGRLGLHAWRVGKRLGIPTVTIFHDWWPEMVRSYRGGRDLVARLVEHDFKNAQRHSDLSLAVCPGMAQHLVYSKNVEVLYPIPDSHIQPRKSFSPSNALRVVYTGSLWNPYGEMLMNLESQIHGDPSIALKIHGDPKYIPMPLRDVLMSKGILQDYLSAEAYKRRVTVEADVLLAVMGGDSEGEIRMATSFPSKVANYFQTGNVVLLWALPGSSLNRFCRDYSYPWFVESSSPAEVVSMLKRLSEDQAVMTQARSDAMRIRDEVFDPVKIQQQFESALQRAVVNHKTR